LVAESWQSADRKRIGADGGITGRRMDTVGPHSDFLGGGIFRGRDAFRAGALGRPLLYGSALGGSLGAQSVHGRQKRLATVMRFAGMPTIREITRDYVARAELQACN